MKRTAAFVCCSVLTLVVWWFGGRTDNNDVKSVGTSFDSLNTSLSLRVHKAVTVEDDDNDNSAKVTQLPRVLASKNELTERLTLGDEEWSGTPSCVVDREVETLPSSFEPKSFCKQFGEHPRKNPARVWYGAMFSFELDMLEVLLHETNPVVDKYVFVESTWSHSKRQKPLFFGHVLTQSRFRPFLHKIINGTFNARRRFRSGWDYEKRQRKRVLQVVQESGIQDGDILIANLDLDEVFSRETVMRYKFCNSRDMLFHTFGYRYNLNCYMDETALQFQKSVILWSNFNAGYYDLYKARSAAVLVPLNMSANFVDELRRFRSQLAWHMSTFGNFEQIRFKLSNSPHRFVDDIDNQTLTSEILACKYNNRTRTHVSISHDTMPRFISRNLCHFKRLGWLRWVANETLL